MRLKDALSIAIVVVVLIVGLLGWRYYWRERTAKLAAQNALAIADTTRVIFANELKVVTERLAEQREGNVKLTGQLGAIAQSNKETGAALLRLRVAFDELKAQTTGTVRTDVHDSTVRLLDAQLDTAGVHVTIIAAVPPPPRVATVLWSHSLDTLTVLQTLTRSLTGQAIWRAEVDRGAKLIADSLVIEREKAAPGFALHSLGHVSIVLGILAGVFGLGYLTGK